MTLTRIAEGLRSCIENKERPDRIIVTESFKKEIIKDNNYAEGLSVGEESDIGYNIIEGDGNYVVSESGNRYEIPDNDS